MWWCLLLKRGSFGSEDYAAILLIVLIFFVYVYLGGASTLEGGPRIEGLITTEKVASDASMGLLTFMRTPVQGNTNYKAFLTTKMEEGTLETFFQPFTKTLCDEDGTLLLYDNRDSIQDNRLCVWNMKITYREKEVTFRAEPDRTEFSNVQESTISLPATENETFVFKIIVMTGLKRRFYG